MFNLPYKETQAILISDFLRQRPVIFFLSFTSWRNQFIFPLRSSLTENNFKISFIHKDLFRFEPLTGLKMRMIFSQSSAFFYLNEEFFRSLGLSELEIANTFFEKSPLKITFFKQGKYFLTLQQFLKLQEISCSGLLEKMFILYIKIYKFFFYSYYSFLLLFFWQLLNYFKIFIINYAYFSSINSKKKNPQSCTSQSLL
jgi:hypothetical protein